MVFGERVKQRRTELGMSQAKLGKLAGGYSYATVMKWEKGENMPHLTTAIYVADALECSLDWLCGLDDRKPEKPASIDIRNDADQLRKNIINKAEAFRREMETTMNAYMDILKSEVN